MFSMFWVVIGALITSVALYDFYKTTLTTRGGGPLSKRLAQGVWMLALKMHRPGGSGAVLTGVGPALILVLLTFWFGLSWLGWFLIFCGSEGLITNEITGAPASISERLYYAGYTLTTVGYGDYTSPVFFGQMASIIGGFNGLVLITLAITYSIPVLSAAVEKRQLALLLHTLGASTNDIIDQGNDDGSFSYLTGQLQSLNSMIASMSYKHIAYPLLHYFHDQNPGGALPLNLVRLHEALTIILFAFPDLPKGKRAQLESTQKTIESLLNHLRPIISKSNSQVPDSPNCSKVKALNQTKMSAEKVQSFLEGQENRKLLLGYILSDGWSWREVHPDKQPL